VATTRVAQVCHAGTALEGWKRTWSRHALEARKHGFRARVPWVCPAHAVEIEREGGNGAL